MLLYLLYICLLRCVLGFSRYGEGAPVFVYDGQELREYSAGFDQEKSREKRSVKHNDTEEDVYNVEITVLVDYSLYKWFWKHTEEPARRNKTLDSIRMYYSNIIHGADIRYEYLRHNGLNIHLWLTSYVIIEDPMSSLFTENIWVRDGLKSRHRRVNSIKALIALRVWDHNRNLSLLARTDHVMAFTRYNLYKLTSDRKNIKDHSVGIAFAESICTMESYSLIEEKGGFKSEGVAAHELGHSLGAFYHDGEADSPGEDCSSDDQFVMAPVNKLVEHWNRDNPYRFSKCSLKQMKDYLSREKYSWCLRNSGRHVDSWKDHTKIRPGQIMDTHKQCKHRMGNESQLCGFHRDAVCHDLWCTVPGKENGCLSTGPAARGTTCGNKKMCVRGRCEEHEDAPEANEFCLYGDYPSAPGDHRVTCRSYIDQRPGKCYNRVINDRCCASCEHHQRRKRPDCVYGDSKSWCTNLPRYRCANPNIKWQCCDKCKSHPFRCYDNRRFLLHGYNCYTLIASFGKRQCYNNRVARMCCATCRRYRNYADPNCLYGDRYEYVYKNSAHPYGYNCDQVSAHPGRYCKQKYVKNDCCGSCTYY